MVPPVCRKTEKSGTRQRQVPLYYREIFPYVGIIQIRLRVRTIQSTLSRLRASSPFSIFIKILRPGRDSVKEREKEGKLFTQSIEILLYICAVSFANVKYNRV